MNALFKKEMPILVEGLKLVHKKFAKRFDMSAWTEGNGVPARSATCNTSGCAIGWKRSFIPSSPLQCKKDEYNDLVPTFNGKKEFQAIMEAYNLTEKEADYLFYDAKYDGGNPSALEVAHRIESVLYNGFPDDLNDEIHFWYDRSCGY